MSNGHMRLVLSRHEFFCKNSCGARGRGFMRPDGWLLVDIQAPYEHRGGAWRGHRGMLFCSWQCVQEGVSNLPQPKGGRQKSRGKEEEDIMVIHKSKKYEYSDTGVTAACDYSIENPDRLHTRWARVTCKRCLKSAPVAVAA